MLSKRTVALSVFVWLAAGSVAFADVHLSFRDGRVSLVARDATVSQILAEWAKIGQTKIVNVERIPGAPLTIELENVSEGRALDVVLRTVSGYIAASRAIDVPNASRFDRIVVMPTSSVIPPSAPSFVARGTGSSEFPAAVYTPPQEDQTPAYSQPQSTYVPPPPADNTPGYDPEAPGAGAAIPSPDTGGSVRNMAQHTLETIDPRKFRLETQPQGGVTVVAPRGAGLLDSGVAQPGMIAQPKPR
jgi:hypothetical protein